MRRTLLIAMMIPLMTSCATQSGISGGVKSSDSRANTYHAGISHTGESRRHSEGFVRGDGRIQRSTRVPGGYPHYHSGYPARGHFERQQHQRHEYHIQPRGRIHYDRGDVQIRGEW